MLRTAIPLALLGLGVALGAAREDSVEVDWIDDLELAIATAEDDGRPLLVVFR